MFILGKNIETVYKRWGMTQKKFAEYFGIVPNTLNNYIGGSRPAKLDFLQKLSNASGFDINTLQNTLLSPFEIMTEPINENNNGDIVSEPKLTYEYDLRKELLLQKEMIEQLRKDFEEFKNKK